jgi:hypothetical protein
MWQAMGAAWDDHEHAGHSEALPRLPEPIAPLFYAETAPTVTEASLSRGPRWG